MGLDNIPQPCGCGKHAYGANIPGGTTHPEGTPCPLDSPKTPKGIFGNCCWLRGRVAAEELTALGESELADRMFEDLGCQEAIALAEELSEAADRLEHRYAKARRKPKGAGWNGTWDAQAKTMVWQTYSTFGEALAAIREAARWYEAVGQAGFGVHAWY